MKDACPGHPPHAQTVRPDVKLLKHPLRRRPIKPDTTHQFRLGSISSPDQLEELWAIDNTAYGAASITYEKFHDW